MLNSILNDIKNVEIDVEVYDKGTRSVSTLEEIRERCIDLKEHGLLNPIIITEINNKPYIVDGYLRYKWIRKFKKRNDWKYGPIDVRQVSLDEAKSLRENQTHNKQFTKLQCAIFVVKNLWDIELEKSKKCRFKDHKDEFKGLPTIERIAKRCSVGRTYINYAHQLLKMDSDFFYEFNFTYRCKFTKDEFRELIRLNKNQPKVAADIINKMKEIFYKEKDKSIFIRNNISIYSKAKSKINKNNKSIQNKIVNSNCGSQKNIDQMQQEIKQEEETSKISAETEYNFTPKYKALFSKELTDDIKNVIQTYISENWDIDVVFEKI